MTEDLLKILYTKNPYKNFDFENFNYDDQNWDLDLRLFEEIDRIKPKLIIEVGTWKGGSAIKMASHIKQMKLDCKILCIDTWLGSLEFWHNKEDVNTYLGLKLKNGYPTVYYQFLYNVIFKNLQDIIIPFPQTSNIVYNWLKWKKIKADLIYIDGSHNEEDVYNDAKNYYELLTEKGVLIGDDYKNKIAWPGVQKAINKFVKENSLSLETTSRLWLIKKVNKKIL